MPTATLIRLCVIKCCVLFAISTSSAQPQETQTHSPDSLLLYTGNFNYQESFYELSFDDIFNFYSKYISPVDGDHRCSFYPSCSKYARMALQQHGYLLGGLLTFERLIRCGYDRGIKIIIDGRVLIYDPLSNNAPKSRP